jgi:hypothetical protein
MGHSVRQRVGLAAAGTGNDEERTIVVRDRRALGVVETFEKVWLDHRRRLHDCL